LLHYFTVNPQEAAAEHLCVSIETAHPAKFPKDIQQVLGLDPELPPSLEGLEDKSEVFATLPNSYTAFREFLQEYY
jgi:threonine synthase